MFLYRFSELAPTLVQISIISFIHMCTMSFSRLSTFPFAQFQPNRYALLSLLFPLVSLYISHYRIPQDDEVMTILERIMDDDKLTGKFWRAETREVELWENERFIGILIPSTFLLS